MKGFVSDIEKVTLENEHFRRVIYTAKNCQLVVMSLEAAEDIGEEAHTLDQFLRCEQGTGVVIIDGIEHQIMSGTAIIVPAGAKHNVVNGSSGAMKLYTLYAPPHHRDGTVHATKADAEKDKEHFDGVVSE